MKSIIPLLLLTTLLIVSSCGQKDTNNKDELYDKVMAVHDDIMPKIGDIMKYKKQLNAKIDKLIGDGAEENEDNISELKKAVEDLENSHEGMMNWMREFDNDFEGKVQEEVMVYLKDQMNRIESVGNTTNMALKNAEKLLTE